MKSEPRDLAVTIAQLMRDAVPVRPLPPLRLRIMRWGLMGGLLCVGAVVFFGVRRDVGSRVLDVWFTARATVTLAIVPAAAIAALMTTIPGSERSRLVRAVPLIVAAAWGVMLAAQLVVAGSPLDQLQRVGPHVSCVMLIVGIALTPGAILASMLARGVPLERHWTAGLGALASAALGAFGAQFVCTDDRAAHHLLWHLVPVLLFTLTGGAVGAALLERSRTPRS